jgi:hypothetical protein
MMTFREFSIALRGSNMLLIAPESVTELSYYILRLQDPHSKRSRELVGNYR